MKRIIFILSIFMITISCNSLSTSEKSIQEYMRTQTELESMSKKDQNYAFLVQMMNSNQRRIKELQEKVIKNGTGYYDGQDPKKVIATLVKCEMTSLINPVLKAKQTKEGVFLLTPDETVCIRQIK